MYEPKSVLITGVTGFIASNVVVYLVEKYTNIKFVGIDKNSYCSNIKNIDEISNKENFKYVQGDILDIQLIQKIFDEHKIDTIIHFAAYSHVDLSFGNSIIFTQNNVVGTHVLLEVAKEYKVKLMLHVSTDEVYGSKDSVSTEDTVLDPTNPYAATKAAAEHLVKSYYHSFKLPIIITRGNNVYGPKQYPEKVIPKFIMRLMNEKKCQIQGTGEQMRSFLYIDDVVRAFETILFKGKIGEIYNIGTNEEHTILDVASQIIDLIYPKDDPGSWIQYIKDRNFNDHRYHISLDKLEKLDWRQQISFHDGIRKTLDWYQHHLDHWSKEQLGNLLI